MIESLVLLFAVASVGLGSVLLAARPLWQRRTPLAADPFAPRDGVLGERKEAALAALEELERDYRVGNVAASDYRALRAELAGSAVLALKDADEEERALDALIEREVAALRGQRAAPLHPASTEPPGGCPACGRAAGPDDRFCSRCGTPVAGHVPTAPSAAVPPAPAAAALPRAEPAPAAAPGRTRATRWLIAGGVLALAFVAGIAGLVLGAPGRAPQQPVATVPAQAVRALAPDPGDPERVLAAADGGVLASADGGRTWQPLAVGLAGEAASVVVPPAAPEAVYAAGRDLLARSRDRGSTWESLAGRLPEGADVRVLAADPSAPDVLYAVVAGAGLYRSRDAGETWAPVGGPGVPGEVGALVVVPVGPGQPALLFAATPREGVLASLDGGARWQNASGFVNGALPTRRVLALAYDPRSGDSFEGAAGGTFRGALYAGTDRGLFKSTDGGSSWNRLPLDTAVAVVAVHPADPRVLLVVDDQRRLFRSDDRGLTWPGGAR